MYVAGIRIQQGTTDRVSWPAYGICVSSRVVSRYLMRSVVLLQVTESSEALLAGRRPPFRLIAWMSDSYGLLSGDVRYGVSNEFVVATRRVRQANKVRCAMGVSSARRWYSHYDASWDPRVVRGKFYKIGSLPFSAKHGRHSARFVLWNNSY